MVIACQSLIHQASGYDNTRPRWAKNRRKNRKKVRPSQLQKLSKLLMEAEILTIMWLDFVKFLFVEDVDDVHTMVQGCGLTLEGKALSWFQSLSNSVLYNFEVLIDVFIKENTKTRIKHNTLRQILDFNKRKRRR